MSLYDLFRNYMSIFLEFQTWNRNSVGVIFLVGPLKVTPERAK